MKHDPKPPNFPANEYVRPNLDWECGHLNRGCPCRIGPSPEGRCRATYECAPRLELKPGEQKGHWTCTRPKSAGGKCEVGPHPDGTCCKAVPKCQPRRTLRAVRKRVVAFTVIASMIIVFIFLSRDLRDEFINPGPVSSVHASDHFAKTHQQMSGGTSACAACHEGAGKGVDSWPSMAFDASKHGLAPADLIKKGPLQASAMDQNCLACHEGMNFHQPNMAAEFACHACHKEHQTSGFMAAVHSDYCTACHGSPELMAQSRDLAGSMSPHAFPSIASEGGVKSQPRTRPDGGHTDVITAFHVDHPEFRQIRDGVKDQNPLKFNHKLHLKEGSIPGKSLSCKDCHEQDGRGEYQRPITYEKHCASCHTLQFDPGTPAGESKPGLYLPHGDPYYVRSFLRSLNIQYEEYAKLHEGLEKADEVRDYVLEKRKGIETLYQSGEHLERAVFFAGKDKKIGDVSVPFEGCATCHVVSEPETENGTPLIAKVGIPDRWMTLGEFNHDLHRKGLSCLDCHNVMESELTEDLNLPSIRSCVDCHSPKGGIDSSCMKCHTYHNSKPPPLFAPAPGKPVGTDKPAPGE